MCAFVWIVGSTVGAMPSEAQPVTGFSNPALGVGKDFLGNDYAPARDITSIPDGARQQWCEQLCDGDPRCLAYTLERRTTDGRAYCWLKNSTTYYDPVGVDGSFVFDPFRSAGRSNETTSSGFRVAGAIRPCWAREVFVLKFCSVVTGLPQCPDQAKKVPAYPTGTQGATFGGAPFACVWRMAEDIGNLPNCTDSFGSQLDGSDEATVNRTCLNAP